MKDRVVQYMTSQVDLAMEDLVGLPIQAWVAVVEIAILFTPINSNLKHNIISVFKIYLDSRERKLLTSMKVVIE